MMILVVPKWLSRLGDKLTAKMNADNTAYAVDREVARMAWRARCRTEMIAKERHEFIREFCVCLLATGAAPRFLAVGGVNLENAATLKPQLEAMYSPDWHDGDIAFMIAKAAWTDYATARYGVEATSAGEDYAVEDGQ